MTKPGSGARIVGAGEVAGHGEQRDQLVGAVAEHQLAAGGQLDVGRERRDDVADAGRRIAVDRDPAEALAELLLQRLGQAKRVLHRVELDQAAALLDRVGVHRAHVLAEDAGSARAAVVAHDRPASSRISAARACASRPSPRASSAAIGPSAAAPRSLTSIRLLRFWKS